LQICKERGDFIMFEPFETNLDEYFYNMTYKNLEKLSQEDENYQKLFNKNTELTKDIRNSVIDESIDLLDDFIDNTAELNAYEKEYLYKKSYCDCLKLFMYLKNL
jgi:hypothetical protein